jgi:hypothetical protein
MFIVEESLLCLVCGLEEGLYSKKIQSLPIVTINRSDIQKYKEYYLEAVENESIINNIIDDKNTSK